jgi:hypothetical protein
VTKDIDVTFTSGAPGFFASLQWCLEVMAYCLEYECRPKFNLTTNYCNSNEDWFDNYFEYRQGIPRDAPKYTVKSPDELWERLGVEPYEPQLHLDQKDPEKLDRLYGPYVWNRFARIRPEVITTADFLAENMFLHPTLGLHYRGSDKTRPEYGCLAEGPFMRFQECFDALPFKGFRFRSIFVATDEPEFLSFIKERSPLPVVTLDDSSIMPTGNTPIFCRQDVTPRKKAVEALLNVMLMARCDLLLKMSSFMSAWAKIFNPALRVYSLTKPNPGVCWYPERCFPMWKKR